MQGSLHRETIQDISTDINLFSRLKKPKIFLANSLPLHSPCYHFAATTGPHTRSFIYKKKIIYLFIHSFIRLFVAGDKRSPQS